MTAEETFRWFMPEEPPAEGCWIWTGPRTDKGYGTIQCQRHFNAQRIRAHRMSYELFVGAIPEGALIRHSCDNPLCVQPSHLVPGTQADNMQDKVIRDRPRGNPRPKRGADSNLSKLVAADVIDIRARQAAGESYRAIAQRYGVTKECIYRIVRRINWAHL